MSFLNSGFKTWVIDQLNNREQIVSVGGNASSPIQINGASQSQRNIDPGTLHTIWQQKTPWLRMTSACDIYDKKKKGYTSDLAQRYVLMGGSLGIEQSGYIARRGFGRASSQNQKDIYAYGADGDLGSTGIRPMPGITRVESRTLDYKGFLKETTVYFTCHNLEQLEALEQLYMRPGYTVMVEWGWSHYINNRGYLETIPVTLDLFDYISLSLEDTYIKLQNRRKQYDGNYDGCIGKVQDYSWSMNRNGSYECMTKIISHGELMQSLKVNTLSSPNIVTSRNINSQSKKKYTGIPIIGTPGLAWSVINWFSTVKREPITSDLMGALYKTKNSIINIPKDKQQLLTQYSADIKKTVDTLKLPINDHELNKLDILQKKYNYSLIYTGVQNSNSSNNTNISVYINWAGLAAIINSVCTNQNNNGEAIQYIDYLYNFNNDNEGYQIQKGYYYIAPNKFNISVDPSVCWINNPGGTKWNFYTKLNEKNTYGKYTIEQPKNPLSEVRGAWPYTDLHIDPALKLGIINNIMINLDYVINLLHQYDGKDLNLHDFITILFEAINSSLGNINSFKVSYYDNKCFVLDGINIVKSDAESPKYEFKIGENSLMKNFSIRSNIFPAMSNMISVAAQANVGAGGGYDIGSLSFWNKDIKDRLIKDKISLNSNPTPQTDSTDEELKVFLENLITNNTQVNDNTGGYFRLLKGYNLTEGRKQELKQLLNSIHLSQKDAFYYNKAVSPEFQTKLYNPIPTVVDLTIDGLSGIVIGDTFKVDKRFIPKGYKTSETAYLINGLTENITPLGWETNITAQYVVTGDTANTKSQE